MNNTLNLAICYIPIFFDLSCVDILLSLLCGHAATDSLTISCLNATYLFALFAHSVIVL
jgi:hypothetical protein